MHPPDSEKDDDNPDGSGDDGDPGDGEVSEELGELSGDGDVLGSGWLDGSPDGVTSGVGSGLSPENEDKPDDGEAEADPLSSTPMTTQAQHRAKHPAHTEQRAHVTPPTKNRPDTSP